MPYPFWDVGLGHGLLMAVIAVVHVFVSHFAIGGGLWLVVAEGSARRAKDQERLDFVRRVSRYFILITVVFGALTGVAIWFIIGLLNPNATEALIHNFVWGWAIEWTFFAIEILAAILYYYGWKRMSAKGHMTLGWLYFAAAFLSLVVINGIITFMLTPGAWLETGDFWDGFFNPTYWPSLAIRTGICILLGGLFALYFASTAPWGALKSRLVRMNALWGTAGLLIAGLSWIWYRAAIPQATMDVIATGRLVVPGDAMSILLVTCVVLLAGLVLFGFAAPRSYVRGTGIAMLAIGLVAFGGFEWFRESARKPYAIYDYMYGTGLRVDLAEKFQNEGLLAHVPFTTGEENRGADLFRYTCRSCHTIDGYRPLAPALDGTDPAFVEGVLANLHGLKGRMPPFPGNAQERKDLATYLWAQVDQRPFEEVYPLEGAALGEAVFEIRCGICHEQGGFRDPSRQFLDADRDLITELIEEEDYTDGMPDFTGTEKEKQALVDYLLTWGEKGGE